MLVLGLKRSTGLLQTKRIVVVGKLVDLSLLSFLLEDVSLGAGTKQFFPMIAVCLELYSLRINTLMSCR